MRKKLYVAKYKTPLHECFENPPSNAADKQVALDELKSNLDTITEGVSLFLSSDAFQSRLKSINTLQSTIGLNMSFLNETIDRLNNQKEGFEDTPPEITYADMKLPFSMNSVTETQKTYVDSIREAMMVEQRAYTMPQLQGKAQQLFNEQNTLWTTLHKKKHELENPPSEELEAKQKKAARKNPKES